MRSNFIANQQKLEWVNKKIKFYLATYNEESYKLRFYYLKYISNQKQIISNNVLTTKTYNKKIKTFGKNKNWPKNISVDFVPPTILI